MHNYTKRLVKPYIASGNLKMQGFNFSRPTLARCTSTRVLARLESIPNKTPTLQARSIGAVVLAAPAAFGVCLCKNYTKHVHPKSSPYFSARAAYGDKEKALPVRRKHDAGVWYGKNARLCRDLRLSPAQAIPITSFWLVSTFVRMTRRLHARVHRDAMNTRVHGL